ncbi:hypothetical protein DID88_009550 [Monilinia fructigena]|uniref:Xylanolytic transcriptional activator regulatory domain-containing protein n=1 Tax=Monilinia fructigena TaxID=38457 RepID=A0A395IN00_9HELO|nr:hypothetical protein DID88_009550 [Monilinia fructigena]
MPEFIIQYLVTSIYNTFGSVLAEPRSREKFIPFVETLLKNEETPLPPSPDDVNEIVVAFRVAIFVLEILVVGDECYGNLNRHGNMVTSACAIGLHRLPHLPPHLLTTAAEYKRRVFAAVYSMDKCSSALNGTPPGIPCLYCRLQMLSDLSETELFLPRTKMQQAIANCDERGCNKKGEIHCGTYYRVSLQNYMVKEEILEGALGVDVQLSKERIDSLLDRASSLSQSRPPQFQFNLASTGRLLLVQLSIRLEKGTALM